MERGWKKSLPRQHKKDDTRNVKTKCRYVSWFFNQRSTASPHHGARVFSYQISVPTLRTRFGGEPLVGEGGRNVKSRRRRGKMSKELTSKSTRDFWCHKMSVIMALRVSSMRGSVGSWDDGGGRVKGWRRTPDWLANILHLDFSSLFPGCR